MLVRDDYDVEVSFTIMNPPLLFSKRKEVKKISWIHGSIEEFLKDSSKRESHRRQLDVADTIVGISKKTSHSIKEVYPDYASKLRTVYNGYDFQSILENLKRGSISRLRLKVSVLSDGLRKIRVLTVWWK